MGESRWIPFACYQGDENNYEFHMRQHGLEVRRLWSSYHDRYAMEEAGFTEDQIEALYKVRTDGFDILSSRETHGVAEDFYVVLSWDDDVTAGKLRDWIKEVAEDAINVGADDSYYDYYPDNFYVMDQLVEALPQIRPDVEAARERARELRYHDDEEDTLG